MPKKIKKTDWGDFYRSEDDFEAMRWCLKNKITIAPLAATAGNAPKDFWIEINIQGRVSRTPETFPSKEVYPQIYKYYKYYYDKHRKSI